MALIRTRRNMTERLQAAPALAMALFEQSGLRAEIDLRFRIDGRQKLTPGNAVKAMIGNMLSAGGRKALFAISDFYAASPNDLLFGERVDAEALNARAFARALDRLFSSDLEELTHGCYRILARFYGLSSEMFNIDTTNFGITSLTKSPDLREQMALPQRCGHAEDGHNERLVYSLLTVTDDNGIVCYERPYDGAAADCVMDRRAIEFLAEKTEPGSTTLVADCKIVTEDLIGLMDSKGFGFVSKCPENFGRRVKRKIVSSVKDGTMTPSQIRKGWELYDTDAEVSGRKLRFVAFRTADDMKEGVEYLRVQGGKEAAARFARFESRTFNCSVDARRAADDALKEHTDSAYVPEIEIGEIAIGCGYGHRGRPRKGEKPLTKTEYLVKADLRFDEERAKRLTQERGIRVLVTNLPRSFSDADNIRFGATADTVLKAYLGQYRIEHAFRLMKDGMGIDRVYIHRPSRENAMMFVISLATMLSDVMTYVMKTGGIELTMQRLSDIVPSLELVYDRNSDTEVLDGVDRNIDLFLKCVEVLRVDPDRLLH